MATLPPNLDLSAIPSSAALFSTADLSSHTTTTTSPPPPQKQTPYTLPQIRAIHGALQARAADVSARLRTRVGESYRELLGTADAIVAMRDDLDGALLPTLGRMGGRCGAGVVAAKGRGLRSFAAEEGKERRAREHHRYSGHAGDGLGAAARRGLLDGVLLGLRRVLGREEMRKAGRGERLVLAARLYVLGRLLVKSLEAGDGDGDGGGGRVAAARKSLETAHRGRLARSIDAVLRSGSGRAMAQGEVLGALAAYSLATSSGARDVLAHFLHVRARAIAMALEPDDDDDDDDERAAARNPQDVLRALGLYAKTLLDVQTLVPHRLGEALLALKEKRLLENASLREMEGLRLDVYRRWCGDEIEFYTPFIPHDDLDGQHAREKLAGWAEKGGEVLLRGLDRTLEGMVEFKAIVELRTSVLKLWIAEGGKAPGFDPSDMLDRLRATINKHMLRVLEAKVAKLRLVGSEVSAALDAWREGTTDRHRSLWDVASLDTDLPGGAAPFVHDVVARLYGRNDAVSKAVTCYRSWFRVVDDVGQVVDQLRRQRWDNDVDEIEDEETIEERQKLLSKADPLALSEHLSRLLVDAFARLDAQLAALWDARSQGPNNGAVAMYMVRLLRDVRASLPDVDAVRGFGLAAVPSLHEAVARAVVVAPLDELATVALARKTVVGRSLWEGEPALPGSPSAGVFRFLRNLTTAMGDAGGDLWSPAAVGVLRRHLGQQMREAWLEAVGALDEVKPAEASDADETEAGSGEETERASEQATSDSEKHRDLLVQWLMDVYYLKLFLGSDRDALTALEEAIGQKSGLDASAKERLAKAAQEYYKRTSLLFGLLA